MAERAKLRWRSAVYDFYKPEVEIEYVGDRRCHVFHCAARGCKATVRRFVVTKDKSSSANLYKHAQSCWEVEVVEQAKEIGDVTRARNVLVAPRKLRDGNLTEFFGTGNNKKAVVRTYSHRQMTRAEIR